MAEPFAKFGTRRVVEHGQDEVLHDLGCELGRDFFYRKVGAETLRASFCAACSLVRFTVLWRLGGCLRLGRALQLLMLYRAVSACVFPGCSLGLMMRDTLLVLARSRSIKRVLVFDRLGVELFVERFMRGISASRLCRLVMSGNFCVSLKASGCIECNLGVAQIRELLHLHRLRLLLYFASFAVLHE